MALPKGYFIAGFMSMLLIQLNDHPSAWMKIVRGLLTEIKDLNRGFDKVSSK